MKKIILIIIILLTGCTKYTDLKDLTIIKSIGIIYENKYTIYAQIYDEIKKDSDPKTKIIESNGKTIEEALNNLKNKVNKEIFLSHIDLLILDTKLDNSNYSEIINYFIHNDEFRNDFLTILSSDIYTLLSKTKYDEIENFIKSNNNIKDIANISFEEIANNYLENNQFKITCINYNNYFEYENYFFNNYSMKRFDNEKNRT